MKKSFFVLFAIINLSIVSAQNSLKFDKRFVQSEDKWVAFPISKDSSYTFGFIYIDPTAGLTFDLAGDFKVGPNGEFIRGKDKIQSSVKARLEPNNILVAHIPESKFSELKIEKIPDWLRFYKEGENSKERLYNWGFMYNGWNECEKALEYLEKAKKLDPNYKGLKVELAFSYNCLNRYDEAAAILKEALISNPKDSYTNKELIYAQAKSGKIEEAEKSFINALKICDDKTYNAENAYQILQGYFLKKDVTNFERWLEEYQNLLESDKRFPPIIKRMKTEIR